MKFRTLLIAFPLLLFGSFSLKAQAHEMEIGLSFSPDVDYRHLYTFDSFWKSVVRDLNELDTWKVGYSVGGSFNYKLKDNITLRTSLLYADRGFQENERTFTDSGFTISYRSVYHYYYLEIPLTVQYRFNEGSFRFYAGTGLSAAIMIAALRDLYYSENGIVQTVTRSKISSSFNPFSLSFSLNAGIEKRFSEKLALCMEPYGRYGLISITPTMLKYHLWNAGILFSIFYAL